MICLHLLKNILKTTLGLEEQTWFPTKRQGHLRQEMVLFYRLHILFAHLRTFHGLVWLGFSPIKYMCNLTPSWKFTGIATELGSLSM